MKYLQANLLGINNFIELWRNLLKKQWRFYDEKAGRLINNVLLQYIYLESILDGKVDTSKFYRHVSKKN